MKKYVAEFIGTAVLVIFGCGTAMLVGGDSSAGTGYLLIALAFGLSIVAEAYSIGNISGCHINPAVSLGVFISGRMSGKDFIGYVIAQILGAICGSFLLMGIFAWGNLSDKTGAYGSNAITGLNNSAGAGFLVEVVLTFVFVLTVLGVTSKKAGHGSLGGLVIGLTLTLVHILGIGLTGTSVNPARSIGPALAAAVTGNGEPVSVLWIFIIAPLLGGAAAAVCYRYLAGKETE